MSLKLNPVVTLGAGAIIWGFVIWSCIDPEGSNERISMWKTWVTEEWTWFYIASQNIWIALLIYLMFSKYRNIRLGKDGEEPAYSYATWFAMLFSCGVATGLFYYSVAEPMWHYRGWGGARWDDYMNDNDKAIHALMVTWYHWGVHGWIPYTVVGALVGILSYRRDMPLTIRFCLYPLIGDHVYGLLGDLIDVLSMVVTLFGVCTSLGLGCFQLNKGMQRLDQGMYRGVATTPEDERLGIMYNKETQIVIIWVITFFATISVVSGIDRGIRRLGEFTFGIGLFLMLSVFFMGDSMYVLNALTETFGYLLWWMPKIAWDTDSMELLGDASEGLGGAPDGLGGSKGWMDSWTIFYWGWWISWAPFVGTFMAKISRGRTLGEFIAGTLLIPSMYSFIWLGTFGSEGIRMDRRAENEGLDCGLWDGNPNSIFSNTTSAVRLWCLSTEDILFDQLASYGQQGFGDFLSVVTMICLVLYFVTSSDSGSLVIDIIGANGIQDPPTLQRIFWALSEGATASVLLNFGTDGNALRALQTVAIVGGLPYTFVLFLMCQSLYYVCLEEMNDLDIQRKGYESFIFQFDHSNSGNLKNGLGNILEAMLLPCLPLGRICAKLWGVDFKGQWTAAASVPFATIILFLSLTGIERQMKMLAAAVYILYVTLIAAARFSARDKCGVKRGDFITDWMLSLVLYFLVLPQLECEIAAAEAKGEFNRETAEEADDAEAAMTQENGIALKRIDSAI